MARPLRIEFPGALYHLTSRGNARAAIFLGDDDRNRFLRLLGEAILKFRWRCYAYCLMTNHYHLVVETAEPNLSRGMRQLNGLYTQGFNRTHARVGHVLQGRYHGILVERETHLLELTRYLVLNPVRAGIVTAAEEYPWSSFRATLGLTAVPVWLAVDGIRAMFDSRARYFDFVRAGVGAPSPWTGLRGAVLGTDPFVAALGDRLGPVAFASEHPRRERLVARESLSERLPVDEISDREVRNARIQEVARRPEYTLAEIGRHLGLHYSTISRIVAQGRRRSGAMR
jgi:REP element-mobilizing transposase RayT